MTQDCSDVVQDKLWRTTILDSINKSTLPINDTDKVTLTFLILNSIKDLLRSELLLLRKLAEPKRAVECRWFMARCTENELFTIANLPKKQALIWKPDFLTILSLDEGTYTKNINWLIRELKQNPPEWTWLSIQDSEGKKWRSLFSRWRTLAKCKIIDIELSNSDRALRSKRQSLKSTKFNRRFIMPTKEVSYYYQKPEEEVKPKIEETIESGSIWEKLLNNVDESNID